MKVWHALLPHVATALAATFGYILTKQWTHGDILIAVAAALVASSAAVVAIAYLPAVEKAMLAAAHGDPSEVTQAVVLCFSYLGESPSMRPGGPNEQLLAYVRRTSNVRTVFVQEGVWVAVDGAPQAPNGPDVIRIVDRPAGMEIVRDVFRFHRHDPSRYLNTLEALFCASQLFDAKQKTLLVTHDLQMARAEFDLRKVCPSCPIIVPPIRGIGFLQGGTHPQACCKAVYKLVELFLARPRDAFASAPISSLHSLIQPSGTATR